MQEEELDSCCAAGERGPEPKRAEGAGRNQHGFSLPFFCGRPLKGGECRPTWMESYAALFAALTVGCGIFFAFSFTANSCLTLASMASVSTL